ncbi:MAG: PHB depolymerase family esterase [Candidatus Eremiobacterota bacterium]
MKRQKRIILLFLLFAFIMFVDCRGQETSVPSVPGTYNCSMNCDGIERTYCLHIPPSYDKTGSVPLVIALHGLGGTGKGMNKLTGFNDVSDKEGFIAVYPDGIMKMWKCDGRLNKHGDLQFISSLIDNMSTSLNIDRDRVYATGMSNGGFMCNYLASNLSDKIAAIAPVGATMTDYQYNNFSPSDPVSVLIMDGTEDPIVHWDGGEMTPFSGMKVGKAKSVDDTVKFWVNHNHCSEKASVTYLEDKDRNDVTKVRREI